jgi:glycosyltransferase involved in cell wall biosynthesis
VTHNPASPAAVSVTAVVPTKNEAANLPYVLPKLASLVDEIVLVDADSTDGTVAVARQLVPDVRVVVQKARGKGSALSAGFAAASGDIVVMLDADGSMDPGEIPGFVGVLLAGADLVKGSRSAPGGRSHDLTVVRRVGNRGLRACANVLFRQRWSELAYGYAAMWRDVVPVLGLDQLDVATVDGSLGYGHGFEIETLMFTRAARTGLVVAEVPSVEYDRIFGVTNLRTFRDGWRVLGCMLRERSRPTVTVTLDRRSRPWHVSAPATSLLPDSRPAGSDPGGTVAA